MLSLRHLQSGLLLSYAGPFNEFRRDFLAFRSRLVVGLVVESEHSICWRWDNVHLISIFKMLSLLFIMPRTRNGAISVAFVRPSVRPSVAYIANNSRTQRPSVSKFGRKVPHLRCDSHSSFKVKRSKVRVRGGRGHIMSAEPGGHTACLYRFHYQAIEMPLLSYSLHSLY